MEEALEEKPLSKATKMKISYVRMIARQILEARGKSLSNERYLTLFEEIENGTYLEGKNPERYMVNVGYCDYATAAAFLDHAKELLRRERGGIILK